MLCFAGSFAQSTNSNSQKTMKNTFSMASIDAYRDNSLLKVTDFYQYLNLLADTSTPEDSKSQISENILSLYGSDMEVADLTVLGGEKITLSTLIQKVKNSGMRFAVIREVNNRIYDQYWQVVYLLEMTYNSKPHNIGIVQKIYFRPIQKQFGNTEKEVWQATLGPFEKQKE
jgi:hypothetical protein